MLWKAIGPCRTCIDTTGSRIVPSSPADSHQTPSTWPNQRGCDQRLAHLLFYDQLGPLKSFCKTQPGLLHGESIMDQETLNPSSSPNIALAPELPMCRSCEGALAASQGRQRHGTEPTLLPVTLQGTAGRRQEINYAIDLIRGAECCANNGHPSLVGTRGWALRTSFKMPVPLKAELYCLCTAQKLFPGGYPVWDYPVPVCSVRLGAQRGRN